MDKYEQDKAKQKEEELKTYFTPRITPGTTELFSSVERHKKKIIKIELQRENNKAVKIANAQKQFEAENKNTVFLRMQNDVKQRKEREAKRKQLK